MADFQRAIQLRDSQPQGAKVNCDYLHSLFPDPVWEYLTTAVSHPITATIKILSSI